MLVVENNTQLFHLLDSNVLGEIMTKKGCTTKHAKYFGLAQIQRQAKVNLQLRTII